MGLWDVPDRPKDVTCVCGYKWRPRVKVPKACPKCKRYLGKKEVKTG